MRRGKRVRAQFRPHASSSTAERQARAPLRIARISKMLKPAARQFADRHRHDRERQQGADHPEDDTDEFGVGHGLFADWRWLEGAGVV